MSACARRVAGGAHDARPDGQLPGRDDEDHRGHGRGLGDQRRERISMPIDTKKIATKMSRMGRMWSSAA